MGGYPHPRDCTRCLCPRGYGGRYCNERVGEGIWRLQNWDRHLKFQPEGCGETLQATQEFQTFEDVLGDGGETKEEFTECNYWIEVRHSLTATLWAEVMKMIAFAQVCLSRNLDIMLFKCLVFMISCSPTFLAASLRLSFWQLCLLLSCKSLKHLQLYSLEHYFILQNTFSKGKIKSGTGAAEDIPYLMPIKNTS